MGPGVPQPALPPLPDGRTRLLGIVGDPLEHSLSPRLHSAVLRALDRNLLYLPFPVSRERLPAFLEMAPHAGILGLNVTTPYKDDARRLVRPADLETERTGMVNTIRFEGGEAVGCGTDGAGILSWLTEIGAGGLPIGVLGFGATARSLVCRALSEGVVVRRILTRRASQARAAVLAWGGGTVEVTDWEQREADALQEPAAVWISTLPPDSGPLPEWFWKQAGGSAGRSEAGAVPPVFLDLNYGPGRVRAVEEARAHGIPAADGTGPLCHQAALSLSLWLGEHVPVRFFFEALGLGQGALRPRR